MRGDRGRETTRSVGAFASLKHSFEKIGDHWEPKDEPGPSDAPDAKRGIEARVSTTPTAGGVNANATKAHLFDIAKRLDINGPHTHDQTRTRRSHRPRQPGRDIERDTPPTEPMTERGPQTDSSLNRSAPTQLPEPRD